MEAYIRLLNSYIDKNKSEYPRIYQNINFINYKQAFKAEAKRRNLTDALDGKVIWSNKNTKPVLNSLSEGCKICSQGNWSCLFITGKCNARCFYCPSQQESDHIPVTQLLNFENPEEYAEYLKIFNFKGMSISGGEPLIVFERAKSYIEAARKKLGNEIYIWLYTNGILGTKKIFTELVGAGLNEIRFDLGATGYSIEFLKNATGIVPIIAVEIPAIPEHKNKFLQLLPDLIKSGVKHINLHQLRLTEFNAQKLLKKNYTFLHGEKVTVLESELAALEIMDYIHKNNMDIGVNYCAFQFKNRFQKSGYRKKLSGLTLNEPEELTEKGYIRLIKAPKSTQLSNYILSHTELKGWKEYDDYFLLNFNILKQSRNYLNTVEISYFNSTLENKSESCLPIDSAWPLPEKQIRKNKLSPSYFIKKDELCEFIELIENEPLSPPGDHKFFSIWEMEYIEWGWRDYF